MCLYSDRVCVYVQSVEYACVYMHVCVCTVLKKKIPRSGLKFSLKTLKFWPHDFFIPQCKFLVKLLRMTRKLFSDQWTDMHTLHYIYFERTYDYFQGIDLILLKLIRTSTLSISKYNNLRIWIIFFIESDGFFGFFVLRCEQMVYWSLPDTLARACRVPARAYEQASHADIDAAKRESKRQIKKPSNHACHLNAP